jgi:ribonucleoside-diphosphate reductase alpha chain
MTNLPTLYQEFIHLSRYARWIEEEKRRETWEETVDRYVNHMCDVQCEGKIPDDIKAEIRESILTLKVMPSMRCMMTAGEALERDNVAGYNCSYVAIDDPKAFDEVLYILMCGTGVGFSVERQFVNKMPYVAERLRPSKTVIGVEDSKIGWANAYRELISMLYQGRMPTWDTSEVRKAGERLKTFGGRSSGPEPLEDLFRFTIEIFKEAQGRRLSSIECHDICCKIGEIVVVGGVRRSALISLSNPSDDRMRHAKSGSWWDNTPWRALANNSACYTEKPGMEVFMREWLSLYDSKSGERGFFNREAVQKWADKFERRDANHEFGCNPCSEIVLRSCGLCNLSEVVVRAEDSVEDLKHKVKVATILGTMQATLTGFRYLRDKWRENAEEEALLGVSLTGIMDNELMAGRKGKKKLVELLTELRDYAVEVNKEWAEVLGINQAAAVTCVKPSGTVSQLVDCASGIHSRYSPYYIRRVRADKKDPLATLMSELGFPCEPDVMKPDNNLVFSFPVKSPEGALVTEDVPSLDHLDLWKVYQLHWCEHKPSITIHLRESEWMDAGAWVFRNFDIVSGISFLPYSGHSYAQAPYEECTEEQYVELLGEMPEHIDWTTLSNYEKEDQTVGSKTYACSGDSCEVVDLTSDG